MGLGLGGGGGSGWRKIRGETFKKIQRGHQVSHSTVRDAVKHQLYNLEYGTFSFLDPNYDSWTCKQVQGTETNFIYDTIMWSSRWHWFVTKVEPLFGKK